MKKFSILITVFCGLTLASCSSKSSNNSVKTTTDKNGYSYETVENDPTGLRLYTLKNGLKVYLSKNIEEPKIQTYIAVRAGSNYDPKKSTGLAHYLEHMLFKGTSKIGTINWETEQTLIHGLKKQFIKTKYLLMNLING
jgi:zinc protease